jgi:hypothetical protein
VVAGLAAVMALGAVAGGIAGSSATLSWQFSINERVAPQDVQAIQTMGAVLPRGSIVLNDGVQDGGKWIAALTDDVEAEPKTYVDLYPDDWRVRAMAAACTDPERAEQALAGVQAVFVGTDLMPAAGSTWTASCIARLPELRLIAGSTSGPAAFAVIGGSPP